MGLSLCAGSQARADGTCYLKLSDDFGLSVPVVPSGTFLAGSRGILLKEANPYGEGHVAIKEAKSGEVTNDIIREARALKKLNDLKSPHFARFYDLRYNGDNPQLVSEWIEGTTLLSLSKQLALDPKIPTREAYRVLLKSIRSALLGLKEIHAADLLHGDIKPDNLIFRPDGTVALIDFGTSSAKTETGYEAPSAAANNFSAPEKIAAYLGTPSPQSYGPKSDIFSLGVTLRWLINNFEMYRMLSDSEQRISNKIVSQTATQMIHSQADKRPSVDEALAAIDQQILALSQ